MKLKPNSDGIRIDGHVGTWYVISDGWYDYTPDEDGEPKTYHVHCFLLEHEEYGDEAACLIVNEEGSILMDDVWNGFDDLRTASWRESPE